MAASQPAEETRQVVQIEAQRASVSRLEAAKRVAENYAQAQARERAAGVAARDD